MREGMAQAALSLFEAPSEVLARHREHDFGIENTAVGYRGKYPNITGE
jgi:hypothetical protein